jgi:hypothetical protein
MGGTNVLVQYEVMLVVFTNEFALCIMYYCRHFLQDIWSTVSTVC